MEGQKCFHIFMSQRTYGQTCNARPLFFLFFSQVDVGVKQSPSSECGCPLMLGDSDPVLRRGGRCQHVTESSLLLLSTPI